MQFGLLMSGGGAEFVLFLTYYMVSRVIISISYPMVHAIEYYRPTGFSYKF